MFWGFLHLTYAVAVALGLAAAYLSFHILVFLCCAAARRGTNPDPELEKIAGEVVAILDAEVGDAVELAGRISWLRKAPSSTHKP